MTGVMKELGEVLRKLYSKTLDYRRTDFSLNYLGLVTLHTLLFYDNDHFVDIGLTMEHVTLIQLVPTTPIMKIFLLVLKKMQKEMAYRIAMSRY